jgi:hypothetical protein
MINIKASDLKKPIKYLSDKEVEDALITTSKVGLYNYTYLPLTPDQVAQLTQVGFEVENTVSCASHEYKVSW